jgi:hypothetical protein
LAGPALFSFRCRSNPVEDILERSRPRDDRLSHPIDRLGATSCAAVLIAERGIPAHVPI